MINKNNDLEIFFKSIKELYNHILKAAGHCIKEFDKNNRLLNGKNKGVVGQIVEEGVIGYKINSSQTPDIEHLGVEIKTTAIREIVNSKNCKKMVGKERVSITNINYVKDCGISFYESHFWRKSENLLFVFWLYESNKNLGDCKFLKPFQHYFDEKDLIIIKKDYEKIQEKIKKGLAHEISDADTYYLSASRKGQNSKDKKQKQPNSKILAPKRCFALKKSYLDVFVDKCFNNIKKIDELTNINEIKTSNGEITDILYNKIKPYFGKTFNELCNLFSIKISKKSKNIMNILIKKILKFNGDDLENSDEFKKANIKLKTVKVNENGLMNEHMSFPSFNFERIIYESWYDSWIYQYFSESKFMFVIFKTKKSEIILDNVVFWNMPINEIEKYVKPVWKGTIELLKEGKIIDSYYRNSKGKKIYKTNFCNPSFNNVCHVRPHDSMGIDKLLKNDKLKKSNKLPVPDKYTKLESYTRHCFWLDKKYIKQIIGFNKNNND